MPNVAVTLFGALKEGLLVAPDYHRPYAWQRQQLESPWQYLDLMPDGAKHHTGTLIFEELIEGVTDVGDTLIKCEVMEGQQRFTACQLLIDVLPGWQRRSTGDGHGSMACEQIEERWLILVEGALQRWPATPPTADSVPAIDEEEAGLFEVGREAER